MRKRFVIVGLGNFGSAAARALYEQGHEIVAVDVDPDAVDEVAEFTTRAAVLDGSRREALKQLGAAKADVGIVSTGHNLSATVLATMAFRDLEVREVYAKVTSDEHARVMRRLGVTETIFPEREAAQNLAARLASGQVIDYVSLGSGIAIQEMAVPDSWQGKSLRDLDVRSRHELSVIAVHDVLTDAFHLPPDPDAPLKQSDTLLITGSAPALEKISEIK